MMVACGHPDIEGGRFGKQVFLPHLRERGVTNSSLSKARATDFRQPAKYDGVFVSSRPTTSHQHARGSW
jgi:hypothetical protein